jgi:hypothetical protein
MKTEEGIALSFLHRYLPAWSKRRLTEFPLGWLTFVFTFEDFTTDAGPVAPWVGVVVSGI